MPKIVNLSEDLEQARSGDLEALGRVVLEARPIALAAARKLARSARRWDVVEDLAAAAVAGSSRGVGGLLAAVQSYNPSLGSWESYAYHRCLEAARSELRLHKETVEITEENEPGTGDEDSVIAAIDARAKLPQLQALPEKQRQVLENVAVGATVADLAADLGLTSEVVRGRLFRARRKFAKRVDSRRFC